MKSLKLLVAAGLLCASLWSGAARATVIEYDVVDLGANQWRYDYYVTNNTLGAPLNWFSIFFDQSLYGTLSAEIAPAGWDPLVQQPDLVLPDPGIFDLFNANSGIAIDGTLSGFSISFQWLGQGGPGSQRFDVIGDDPGNPLETGFTTLRRTADVPEPATLTLLGLSLLVVGRRRKHV